MAAAPIAPLRDSRIVALLCLAEALSMTGFAAYPAFLPTLRAAWGLSGAEAGFVGGAFFFGYMLAVPLLSGITDRIDARGVFAFSCALAAAGTAGFALLAHDMLAGALWQALTGAGLAGTYMPGLKALTDRIGGPRQARFIAFYTSTFGIGTSLSLLLSGWLGAVLPWRTAFALLALGPLLAVPAVLAGLRAQRPQGAHRASWLPRFGAVLAVREVRRYVFGYALHCWELFGLRSWLVAFIVFAYAAGSAHAPLLNATEAAALINVLGLPASILGNEAAGRWGRRPWIAAVMAVSGLLCWLAGFAAAWPWWLMLATLALYFVATMADSAALTAGLVAATPLAQRGAAMAVYSLLGFGAGFVSPLAFGFVLDAAGGGALAWGLAFGTLGSGSLAWAAWSRRREPAGKV
ncbi:MAG: MFS transporter [Rhodocyclaceae bacterium]|nr:MFS transporter [Rhodocyclaceae bacterium]